MAERLTDEELGLRAGCPYEVCDTCRLPPDYGRDYRVCDEAPADCTDLIDAWNAGQDSLRAENEHLRKRLEAAEGAVEPGAEIGTAVCPCCGAYLEIDHGDEPGQIAIVGTAMQERRE